MDNHDAKCSNFPVDYEYLKQRKGLSRQVLKARKMRENKERK